MSARQDYVALDWVKGDITETLSIAQQELEAVAENPDNTSSMRSCLTAIHQVHGTLKIVELEVAIQFAEEMEVTTQALMNHTVSDTHKAQEMLMQAILQMPRYLERVQKDQQESLDYILPIINGLREVRGEQGIGEAAQELVPDASIINKQIGNKSLQRFSANNGQAIVRKLRQRYQQSLRAILSKQEARENLGVLAKVFVMLAKICGNSPSGRLAQLVVALVEAISNGSVKLNSALSLVLRKIDRELKQLAEEGVDKLKRPVAEELILSILKPLLNEAKETERIISIKKIYSTGDRQDKPATRAFLGPDDETVSTVVKILIEEIVSAKDKLDLYVRSQVKSKDDLQALIPGLKQISNTLSVVGLDEHRESIQTQIEVLSDAVSKDEEPAEDQLLGVAGAFLKVETILSSMVTSPDDMIASESIGNLDEAHAVVIKETRNGLAQCKDRVIDFISSEWDHANIEGLPKLLTDLRGGLSMLTQSRAGDILLACAGYVETGLLEGRRVPELDEMEDLADVLTSADYYLERFLENSKDPYIQMLEVAETSLEKLGYPVGRIVEPTEQDQQPAEELIEEREPEEIPDTQVGETVLISPEFEMPEPVSEDLPEEQAEKDNEVTDEETEEDSEEVTDAATEEEAEGVAENVEVGEVIDTIAEATDELIDDEIIEIFIEEADEVMQVISEQLPIWRSNPQDTQSLTELRRAFHTLKGSGTMVGATVVGQLAWSIEDMLNRVIDNAIDASPGMIELITLVVDRIPAGVKAFENRDQQSIDVTDLIARAERYCEGQGDIIEEGLTEGLEAAVESSFLEEVSPELAEVSEAIVDEELIAEPVEEAAEVDEFTVVEEPVDEPVEEEAAVDELTFVEEPVDKAVEEEAEVDELTFVEEPVDESVEEEADEIASDEPNLDQEVIEEPVELDVALEEISLDVESTTEADHLEDAEIHLDPELVEIFEEEAASHMEVLDTFIAEVEAAPKPVSEELLASLHTLKGSASMAEIDGVAQIAKPLEKYCNRLYERNIQVKGSYLDLLRKGRALLVTALGNIDEYAGKLVEGTGQLQQALATLGTEIVDHFDSGSEIDRAEVTPFSFDGIDLLLDADELLARWEEQELTRLGTELEQLGERAALSGRPELHSLVQSLSQAHAHFDLSSRPADAILTVLLSGHEAVIDLLDQMAASQEVSLDESVLEHLAELVEDLGKAKEADVEDETDVPRRFVLDTWNHLNNMAVAIQKWKEDINNLKELEQLNRHVNLIRNAAELAGVSTFIAMCDPVIKLCERITTGELFGTESDVRLFEEYRNKFADLLNELKDGHGIEPAKDLISQVEGRMRIVPDKLTDAAQSEELEDEVDEEILSIFLEEADELLESIDQSIHDWNSNRNTPVYLENLLRYLHTIKGGSRLAGLNSLGEYSHNFETFLIDIQKRSAPVDDNFFADLNRRQDEVVRRIEIYRRLATGEVAVEDLATLTRPQTSEVAESVEAEPAVSIKPELVSESTPSTPVQVAAEPTPAHVAAAPTAAATASTSAPQEMIRVSADLLEELISLATECSINRGRIEQQISNFAESLDEMEMTVRRVRDQVRRLEIETESRETIYRGPAGEEKDAPFDELEMDRYTMLQEISRTLMEGVSDMLDLKDTLVDTSRDAETLLVQQARVGNELQEGLTRTRMVPFSRLLPRLRRITRQISVEVGKKVRFDAYNIEGELDRNVLERIVAPLEHMLRNAVDHGIESAEERKAANKPEVGRISLRLSREGGYVVLSISDDGGGIDVEEIKAKAISQGLMAADSNLSDQEILQFIMKAGFSTAKNLTQISGRGVGMDVVDTELSQLGGTMNIESTVGVGTEFTMRIPFTVSINRALMVEVREEIYAVPLNTIEGIVRVSPYELEAYYEPEAPMFEYAGQPYRLEYMGKILARSENPDLVGKISPLPVILARSGDHAVALQVDRVIGSREVVVKSLGQQLSKIGGVSGATILGDGSVVIILDVMALVRASDAHDLVIEAEQETDESEHVRTIMIVDDSVTVRKVTSRIVERQGWDVMLAKDGVDAISQLQDHYPDLMLLDIEMPKMDGFEVLRTVRRDQRLKDLPIIMITSRTGEKHKRQAKELGVNEYLGKPFQEENLLSIIEEVLAETKS